MVFLSLVALWVYGDDDDELRAPVLARTLTHSYRCLMFVVVVVVGGEGGGDGGGGSGGGGGGGGGGVIVA